jgi:hypothetical protein
MYVSAADKQVKEMFNLPARLLKEGDVELGSKTLVTNAK